MAPKYILDIKHESELNETQRAKYFRTCSGKFYFRYKKERKNTLYLVSKYIKTYFEENDSPQEERKQQRQEESPC